MIKKSHKIFTFRTQRNTFAFVFLILVFLFICASFLFSYYSQKRIEQNTINYMSLINYQIDVQINNVFKGFNRVLFAGTIYPDFVELLNDFNDLDEIEYFERLKKINSFIRFSNWVNPYMVTITFIDNSGDFFNEMGGTEEHLTNIRRNIDYLDNSGKKIYITPVIKTKWFSSLEREVFSLFSILNDINSGRKFGYACIDIDFKDMIKRILSKQTGYQGNYIQIFESSRLIYSDGDNDFSYLQIVSGIDISHKLRSGIGRSTSQSVYRSKIGSEEYLIVLHTNERTGWELVQYQNVKEIKSSNRAISLLYIVVIIALLLISVFFIYLLNRSTMKSVNKLVDGMEKVEKGEIVTIDGHDKGDSEIDQLIKSFNNMARNLRESIYHQFILKTEQKRTELKMLQSQINPHFLANTLTLIQSIARTEKNKIIPQITQNLIHMFRYSIDGRREVAIKDEIENIKKYIEIQELRFPERCSVEYDIKENIQEFKIIKFILQPLIENSYYHGIERTKRNGKILVKIYENEGDTIKIIVKDNGIGIEDSKLNSIRKDLEIQRDKLISLDESENLGLRNVCYRIKDYYGEEYGLYISSKYGSGTCIEVLVPKQFFIQ